MIEAISSIAAGVPQIAQIANTNQAMQSHGAAQTSFSDLVQSELSQVDSTVKGSEKVIQQIALGDDISVHEAMISMQQAKLHLQMVVEVRNKVLEAYQEVMRMQL